MMGCNMFKEVVWKIIPKVALLPLLIWGTVLDGYFKTNAVSILR